MTKEEFIKNVQEETGIKDYDEAEKATSIVLQKLSNRLTSDESFDVESQLPTDLKELWNDKNWVEKYFGIFDSGKAAYETKAELYSQIGDELAENDIEADTDKLVKCVIHCLKMQVSEGEIDDVAAQMPSDIKPLFAES